MRRWLALTLAVAAACAATGLPALPTADPAPVVWPPVGVAFAALLVGGRRLWPGVWAAAFALALVGGRRLAPAAELAGAAALLATAYAAQAVAGVWLARRLIPDPLTLSRPRDALTFLLIAGPLHTLPASAVAAALVGGWPAWWAADAAGGLVFAPVALALVGRPREVWRPRLATVALPLLLVSAVAAAGVLAARVRDRDRARERLDAEADRAAAVLQADIAPLVEGLGRVRREWPASALQHAGGREVARHDLLAARPAGDWVRSVEIDLLVSDARRDAFEEKTRRSLRPAAPGFFIADLGADGRLTRAGRRSEYVVGYQFDPPPGRGAALGRDFAPDPARAEAYAAARAGRAVVRPAPLPDGRDGALLVVPLSQEPGAGVGGFVVATLDLPAWAAHLRDGGDDRVALALRPAAEPAPEGGLRADREVTVADRPWRLTAAAGPGYAAAHRTRLPSAVGLGGLLLAGLLGAVLLGLTGRGARAEAALRECEAERKRFEENLPQTQRLESLGLLAGGVAHDFNNLLTGILGNVTLARDQLPPGSDLHEFLRPVEKSAEHAAQLCRDLLTHAGRRGSVRGAVDLNALIDDSAELLRLAVARKAELRIEPAPRLPTPEGDAGELRQVLLNLVQNASEALGPQGGVVAVRTGGGSGPVEREGPGRWVGEPPAGPHAWLEVADGGHGMDEATAAKVFDPFFTTKFTGRGLGLAAVRRIVLGHGGAVRLSSRPGRGTVFRIYLPAAASPTPTPTNGVDAPTPLPSPAPGAAPRAALVADDEPSVRHLAVLALRAQGFTVAEAADGREAVELFRAEPGRFTLVVLDLSMPELDGREALAAMRKLRPGLPAVLTSGYAEADVTGEQPDPAVYFLQKPFRPVDLTSLVRRVVAAAAG